MDQNVIKHPVGYPFYTDSRLIIFINPFKITYDESGEISIINKIGQYFALGSSRYAPSALNPFGKALKPTGRSSHYDVKEIGNCVKINDTLVYLDHGEVIIWINNHGGFKHQMFKMNDGNFVLFFENDGQIIAINSQCKILPTCTLVKTGELTYENDSVFVELWLRYGCYEGYTYINKRGKKTKPAISK